MYVQVQDEYTECIVENTSSYICSSLTYKSHISKVNFFDEISF